MYYVPEGYFYCLPEAIRNHQQNNSFPRTQCLSSVPFLNVCSCFARWRSSVTWSWRRRSRRWFSSTCTTIGCAQSPPTQPSPGQTKSWSQPLVWLNFWRRNSVVNLWHFGADPDPRIRASDQWIRIRGRILLFTSLTFKTPTKKTIFK